MHGHEIATLYPNGTFKERYATHAESCIDGEWLAALDNCLPGYTVIRYLDDKEIDRFTNE